jgi:hypothetical protein
MEGEQSVVQRASVTVRRHTYLQGVFAMSTVTLFYRCIPELVLLDIELPPYSRLLFGIIAMKAHLDTGIVQMTTEYLSQSSKVAQQRARIVGNEQTNQLHADTRTAW